VPDVSTNGEIGRKAMPLNLNSTNTHVVFDEYGMALVKGDELSWRDSIGRTVLCWLAYEGPIKLLSALDDCMYFINSEQRFQLYRHPEHKELSSRDHWSYYIICEKLADRDSMSFINFMNYVPRMRGLNLWMKSLAGNKRAEWWYYFWNLKFARIGNFWLKFVRKVGNISNEKSNEWWITIWDEFHAPCRASKPFRIPNGSQLRHFRTPWQNFWGKVILWTIPAFALHIKAWQIYVMSKDSRKTTESDNKREKLLKKRKKLQQILLKRVGKSNILVRLLLGDDVSKQEITDYPYMTNYRPGVYLDESCRRDIREMTPEEAEFNTYEVDLIKWLYESTTENGI